MQTKVFSDNFYYSRGQLSDGLKFNTQSEITSQKLHLSENGIQNDYQRNVEIIDEGTPQTSAEKENATNSNNEKGHLSFDHKIFLDIDEEVQQKIRKPNVNFLKSSHKLFTDDDTFSTSYRNRLTEKIVNCELDDETSPKSFFSFESSEIDCFSKIIVPTPNSLPIQIQFEEQLLSQIEKFHSNNQSYHVLQIINKNSWLVLKKQNGSVSLAKRYPKELRLDLDINEALLKFYSKEDHKTNFAIYKDIIEENDSIILIREYCQETLDNIQPRTINSDVISNLLLEICQSLKVLGENQMNHMNIKSENILVTHNKKFKLADPSFFVASAVMEQDFICAQKKDIFDLGKILSKVFERSQNRTSKKDLALLSLLGEMMDSLPDQRPSASQIIEKIQSWKPKRYLGNFLKAKIHPDQRTLEIMLDLDRSLGRQTL
eukprot:TRINITY_DN7891_c0_g1_i1.p1 TRINITY_DN7891_c0_g1~~TRINITY_DN7891_c0_g1_i1.p1  ORF type:complete len:431 (+),score=64.46 TRINITY_DN7891_c0_g1_i1:105-1397(+)